MDPDAAWLIIRDENAGIEARRDAALDLVTWLSLKGFPPAGTTFECALQVCGQVLS